MDQQVSDRTKRVTPRIIIPFGAHARFGKPVAFDSDSAVNAHMLVAGPSGTGKTHQLNRIIFALAEQGARVIVIDPHGDLGEPGDIERLRGRPFPGGLVQTVKFGEQTRYGLPPLDVVDDPEGGPRRRANSFVSLMERQGALGARQRTALFRLLMDLYRRHGFHAEDPRTWSLDFDPRPPRKTRQPIEARPGKILLPGLDWFEFSDSERQNLKQLYSLTFNSNSRCWECPQDHQLAREAFDKWGGDHKKRQPTLSDLKHLLWDRLVAMKMGQSAPAVRSLEKVMSLAQRRNRLANQRNKAEQQNLDDIEDKLAKAREESLEIYKNGLEQIDSGKELEELIIWDNSDAIKSLYDRIESLEACGIFKGDPAPFDAATPIWRYNIKSLTDEEQQLFVEVLLERVFADIKAKGEATGPDTFVLLDESVKFIVHDNDHVINRIINEARKYGLGIIMGSQAFMHFSDNQLISAAVKLVLGCPEMYREPMRRKLALDMVKLNNGSTVNPLALIKPKQTAMVSIATAGTSGSMQDIDILPV